MSGMSKGWTEERRKKQAETIRKNRPWEKSTGPKTAKGKKRSSYNALKNGTYSQKMKFASELLRLNSQFRQTCELWSKSEEFIALQLRMKEKRSKNKLKENTEKTKR